jgi:spermidine synthase
LYESNFATVKSELATFLEVFPHCTAWSNRTAGGGYDLVLLGSVEPLVIDLDALHNQLSSRRYQFVNYSLREVGFKSELDLIATYAGQASDWHAWLANAEINRDMNLRLQFLAGILPPRDARTTIHQELLRCRTIPVDLFRGSAERVGALKRMLAESK